MFYLLKVNFFIFGKLNGLSGGMKRDFADGNMEMERRTGTGVTWFPSVDEAVLRFTFI